MYANAEGIEILGWLPELTNNYIACMLVHSQHSFTQEKINS